MRAELRRVGDHDIAVLPVPGRINAVGSVNTERLSMIPPKPNPERDDAIEERFQAALQILDALGGHVFRVSTDAPIRTVELRMGWSYQILVRVAMGISSINLILGDGIKEGSLDHFTIASLGRTIIDASLMILYLSIPEMSKDEWIFRKAVIDLHDATKNLGVVNHTLKRAPFEGSGKIVASAKHLERMIKVIKSHLIETTAYKSLDKDRRQSLITGKEVFARGKRNAIREAGLDLADFNHAQDQLSAYVHTLPASFYVSGAYGVDYTTIVPFQKEVVAKSVLGFAYITSVAAERMALISSNIEKYLANEADLDVGWVSLRPEPDV